MTHAPETGTINRLRFSGDGFWYVCHVYLRPDSSDTRFQSRLQQYSIVYSTPGIPKGRYSSQWHSISELRDVTCHMGSHSVTCHPIQVNAPRLTPAMQA